MSAPKHTPGPWTLDGTTVYALDTRGIANRMSASVQGGFVTRDHRFGGERTTKAELEANARLIAAAPDLLAALQMALGYVSVEGSDEEFEQAQSAISKAGVSS